mmetsp:Transcript_2094/g.4997  ORF Transcript_2094/g.4997 Transcript_2094/m.4997 type:complete len:320 (-) Transcript_2094:965-1924(-)
MANRDRVVKHVVVLENGPHALLIHRCLRHPLRARLGLRRRHAAPRHGRVRGASGHEHHPASFVEVSRILGRRNDELLPGARDVPRPSASQPLPHSQDLLTREVHKAVEAIVLVGEKLRNVVAARVQNHEGFHPGRVPYLRVQLQGGGGQGLQQPATLLWRQDQPMHHAAQNLDLQALVEVHGRQGLLQEPDGPVVGVWRTFLGMERRTIIELDLGPRWELYIRTPPNAIQAIDCAVSDALMISVLAQVWPLQSHGHVTLPMIHDDQIIEHLPVRRLCNIELVAPICASWVEEEQVDDRRPVSAQRGLLMNRVHREVEAT